MTSRDSRPDSSPSAQALSGDDPVVAFGALGTAWRTHAARGATSDDGAGHAFAAPDPDEIDAVRKKAGAFRTRLRVRNAIELLAAALLLASSAAGAFEATTTASRLTSIVMFVSVLFVAAYIVRFARPLPAPPPDAPTQVHLRHARDELERQARLLARVRVWYLAPLGLPVMAFYGTAIAARIARGGVPDAPSLSRLAAGLALTIALFVFVDRLNRRAAKTLDARRAALPPLDED